MKKYGGYVLLVLVFFALVIRLMLAETMKGYGQTDLWSYQRWAEHTAADFAGAYRNTDIDYPPLYLYVLYFIGKAFYLINDHPLLKILLLKLPAILADMVTGMLVYRFAGKYSGKPAALIISALFLFNPAVFVNSSVWGQTDSILTLIAFAALYFLSRGRIVPSTVFFAMACLMKPQGFIFLTVLFLELVKKRDLRKFLISAVTGLATCFLIILPFTIGQDVFWIVRLYLSGLAKYAFADVHAFNLFFLMGGDLVPDTRMFMFLPYKTWSMIFTACVFGLTGYMYLKSKNPLRVYLMTLVLQSCVFMFTGRMHERYLFPAVLLMIMVFILCGDRRLVPAYVWLSALVFINHALVLYCSDYLNDEQKWLPYFNLAGGAFSLVALILVIYLVKISWDILLKDKISAIECDNRGHMRRKDLFF